MPFEHKLTSDDVDLLQLAADRAGSAVHSLMTQPILGKQPGPRVASTPWPNWSGGCVRVIVTFNLNRLIETASHCAGDRRALAQGSVA